ncbi:hypothetical protein Spla01_02571 [Streptomyces platensis]|uniref:Uncharacterized protein n=1 Tax=Streptomyces platensis TaxID=58346 RepID=A0ABX3XVD7_STRPT|nr:hypothetical protein BG653_03794 [Streptomyces platensis]
MSAVRVCRTVLGPPPRPGAGLRRHPPRGEAILPALEFAHVELYVPSPVRGWLVVQACLRLRTSVRDHRGNGAAISSGSGSAPFDGRLFEDSPRVFPLPPHTGPRAALRHRPSEAGFHSLGPARPKLGRFRGPLSLRKPPDSQAQSAGSIPVTRSKVEAQVSDLGLGCCLDRAQRSARQVRTPGGVISSGSCRRRAGCAAAGACGTAPPRSPKGPLLNLSQQPDRNAGERIHRRAAVTGPPVGTRSLPQACCGPRTIP